MHDSEDVLWLVDLSEGIIVNPNDFYFRDEHGNEINDITAEGMLNYSEYDYQPVHGKLKTKNGRRV